MNLLTILDALLRYRHVSRAAKAVGLTQSATSSALSRLRHLFADELLVRTGNKMILTEKATALADPVRVAVEQIRAVFSEEKTFVPSESTKGFRVIATDYVQTVLLAPLYDRFHTAAPQASLCILPPTGDLAEDALAAGDVDAVFAPFPSDSPHLYRQELFVESFVGLVCAQHPHRKKSFTLEQLLQFPHVTISFRGDQRTAVDQTLTSRGKTRHISLTVPSFFSAVNNLRHRDLVLIAPKILAKRMASDGNFSLRWATARDARLPDLLLLARAHSQ